MTLLDHRSRALESARRLMRLQTLYEGRWIFAVLAILALVAVAYFCPWLSLLVFAADYLHVRVLPRSGAHFA